MTIEEVNKVFQTPHLGHFKEVAIEEMWRAIINATCQPYKSSTARDKMIENLVPDIFSE